MRDRGDLPVIGESCGARSGHGSDAAPDFLRESSQRWTGCYNGRVCRVRIVPAFVCLAFCSIPEAVRAESAAELRGLVISIDGLKGDDVAAADRLGLKIPTVRRLIARGARASGVRGIFPSVTYPSHTTLITGCYPTRHGILANGVFDPPTTQATGRWYWNYGDIRVPTILDAAKAAGWTTAAVGWPVTVGAPADYLFPEVWRPEHFDQRLVEMSMDSKPRDLLAEVLTRYDLGPSVGDDETLTRVARYIAERYKPRLMLVHLVDVDHAEHSKGPGSPEAMKAIEDSDRCVGEILASYENAGLLGNTLVAIVSDHGFLPIEKQFNVNVVLRNAGLIRFREPDDKHAADYDAAGWVAGGSCAIVLRNESDTAALERARDALRPYAGPGRPIRRMLERNEIAKAGSNPRAALMLDAGDGYTFGSRISGEAEIKSGMRGMHGQMPERAGLAATLILAGPGVRAGVVTPEIRMVDVAPTLAGLLGLQLKQADGRVVTIPVEAGP